MARYPNAGRIYKAIDQFTEDCLIGGRSLLWPEHNVWTSENLNLFWKAFAHNPDLGSESFIEKWSKQLAGQPKDLYRMAADVTAIYCLFPSLEQMRPETKFRLINDVKTMGPDLDQPDKARWSLVSSAIEDMGIGMTGTGYMAGRPFHIAMFLSFAIEIKDRQISSMRQLEPNTVVAAALQRVRSTLNHQPFSSANIILHLFWPDLYEGTSSVDHKRRMAEGLSRQFDLAPLENDDATILQARQHMETYEGFPKDFNMYVDPIRGMWDDKSSQPIVSSRLKPEQARRAFEVSNEYHNSILIHGRSFLWPDERLWTLENVREAFEVVRDAWDNKTLTSIPQVGELLLSHSETSFKIGFDVQIADILRRDQSLVKANEYLDRFRLVNGSPAANEDVIETVLEVSGYRTPGSQAYRSNMPLEYYLVLFGGLLVLLENPSVIGDRDEIHNAFLDAQVLDSRHDYLPFWALMYRFYPDQFVGVPGYTPRKQYIGMFDSLIEGKEFPNDFAALSDVREQIRGGVPVELFDFFDASVSRYAESLVDVEDTSTKDIDLPKEETFDLDVNEDPNAFVSPTISDLANATFLDKSFLQDIQSLLESKKQLIFEGPPGSGKTYVADQFSRYFTGQSLSTDKANEQIELVQFHQSYSYEDFVEGIRPRMDGGQLVYTVEAGIFLRMVARAADHPEQKYVLIIDEINRGNVSRILGELMLLLEYRDKSATLPYSKDQLQIPPNLYIIGTMNTADRSLSQIDYALRRRFYFVRFMSVENNEARVLDGWLRQQQLDAATHSTILQSFITLNQQLETDLGTDDLQVGHSYFMDKNIHNERQQQHIWTYAVLPLIREYLYHHRERDSLLKNYQLDRIIRFAEPAIDDQVESETSADLEEAPE